MERPLIVGAQASEPNGVTIWRTVRDFLNSKGLPVDYALFSSYEALDHGLMAGAIDIAWNAPMAQAQTLIQSGGACRVLAMRDTDREVTTLMLVAAGSEIAGPADLNGKRIALGDLTSSELRLIPTHQLRQDGFDLATECEIVDLEAAVRPGWAGRGDFTNTIAALDDGIIDAGTVFEPQYRALVERARIDPAAYRVVWNSRPYSHCGFAARPGLPEDAARRFVELLASMDYSNPDIKEMMDLEHLCAWVPADDSGWQDLISGIKDANLVGALF